MHYLDLSINEIHKALLENKVSPLELVQEALKRAHEDTNNAFEYICDKEALEELNELNKIDKNNPLWGIPYVLKDNFSTKGIPTTGSSEILKNYVPVFSSEVYLRLKKAGAILIGKTTLDELAMGGNGKTGHLGYTYNPWDPTHKHIIGGSSCGSAAAVAASIVPFAIGSDTGDSVRKPASYAGLVGLKPTWGRISRYGLFPFASSMDHVAFFTRNVYDSSLILENLAGRDEKDSTSSFVQVDRYSDYQKHNHPFRLAVIQEMFDSISKQEVKELFLNNVDKLREVGYIVDFVHLDESLCKAIYPTYIIISSSEATSNNANLDGIKFGTRLEGKDLQDIMMKTRTNGFSELIKRRFIVGGYSLLKENQHDLFLRAQKCRRLIVNAINKILEKYDAIYLPSSASSAPLFDEQSNQLSNEYLIANNHLKIANFGGLPSITVPLGFIDDFPIGANITGNIFKELDVFAIAQVVENVVGLSGICARSYRK